MKLYPKYLTVLFATCAILQPRPETWQFRRVEANPLQGNSAHIFFADSETGFIYSRHQLLRSLNHGETWINITDRLQDWIGEREIKTVRFSDRNTGWLWMDRVVLVTNDGGMTWGLLAQEPSGDLSGEINGIFFMPTLKKGWLGGGRYRRARDGEDAPNNATGGVRGERMILEPVIYRTDDGGLNWDSQTLSETLSYRIFDLTFGNSQMGIATGDRSVSFTRDGGYSWAPGRFDPRCSSRSSMLAEEVSAGSLHVQGKSAAWLALADGKVLYSSSGGSDWCEAGRIPLGVTAGEQVAVLRFADLRFGLAVVQDRGGLFRSEDGGNTWSGVVLDAGVSDAFSVKAERDGCSQQRACTPSGSKVLSLPSLRFWVMAAGALARTRCRKPTARR